MGMVILLICSAVAAVAGDRTTREDAPITSQVAEADAQSSLRKASTSEIMTVR